MVDPVEQEKHESQEIHQQLLEQLREFQAICQSILREEEEDPSDA